MAGPQRSQFERSLVGPAGEHYVIFRLYQQGLLASLAPGGSPTVDVLVLSPDETVIASLQLKTRTYGRDQGWHMREKHESIVEPRLFHAFVDLEPEVPATFIVPSQVVADVLKRSHQRGSPFRERVACLIETIRCAACSPRTRMTCRGMDRVGWSRIARRGTFRRRPSEHEGIRCLFC